MVKLWNRWKWLHTKVPKKRYLKPRRQYRSYMRTLNHLQRFILDLHKREVHFRASLKACNKHSFLWEKNATFYNTLEIIAKIPSVYYFDSIKNWRKKCDASNKRLCQLVIFGSLNLSNAKDMILGEMEFFENSDWACYAQVSRDNWKYQKIRSEEPNYNRGKVDKIAPGYC